MLVLTPGASYIGRNNQTARKSTRCEKNLRALKRVPIIGTVRTLASVVYLLGVFGKSGDVVIPNTNAYAVLRDKSQQFLDFVVLSSTAVPVLKSHLDISGVTGLHPDHFKGPPDKARLIAYASTYQETLGRMIVITLFSYFEAYVKGVMSEIIDFHGGEAKFQATADRRAKAFIAASSQKIVDSKRKLQEPAKGAKVGSYQKHSAILVGAGFRFPSELLAPYGVKNLVQ